MKITMTTGSGKNPNFNGEKERTEFFLQAGTCGAWTPVVSGVPFEKEFKVQLARDRVAARRLGSSGQRRPILFGFFSISLVLHAISQYVAWYP